eukprot:6179580-Prymnesium_polylepis.1
MLPHQIVVAGKSARSFPDFGFVGKKLYVKTREGVNSKERASRRSPAPPSATRSTPPSRLPTCSSSPPSP